MNENTSNGGNGDSDGSMNGEGLCRDFMRNVCNRGKNCKFIHPENVSIQTEPIFCHDYQQGKCFRSTCKFIHCTREDEEHYKHTGELRENLMTGEECFERPKKQANNRKGNRNSGGNVGRNGGSAHMNGSADDGVPICKDFLKGVCARPPGGCKYRHVMPSAGNANGGRGATFNNRSRGGAGLSVPRGVPAGAVPLNRRRPAPQTYYAAGPRAKRHQLVMDANEYYDNDCDDEYGDEEYVAGYNATPSLPSLSQGYSPHGHVHSQGGSLAGHGHGLGHGPSHSHGLVHSHNSYQQATSAGYNSGGPRHGYNAMGQEVANNSVAAYFQSPHSTDAMKALEDENFMLKRRIEELKTSNEFLLSQNAQLRLNNSLTVNRNSVAVENVQVQQTVNPAASVVQTLVSMAQPMGMTMTPTLSVSATHTQPMSTISTMPNASMAPVTISQALPVVSIAQHPSQQPATVYPMVTTQGVLPPPN